MINTLTGKLMSLLVELQKMRNFRIVKRYITYDVIKVVFLSNKMEDRGTIQRSTCQIKYRWKKSNRKKTNKNLKDTVNLKKIKIHLKQYFILP